MKAQRLFKSGPAETSPLMWVDIDRPAPVETEVLLRVETCGVCRTDLHIVEGDIPLPKLPIIPGHQIVGTVENVGSQVKALQLGQRVGVPWLYSVCGRCGYCSSGKENLCTAARFSGYHVEGGYAEFVAVAEEATFPIDDGLGAEESAPLLCAGVIGYRALRLSEIQPGEKLAMYGFGASAHIALQIAVHQECQVYVFSRGKQHLALAEELGASWCGSLADHPPHMADGAVVFAPAGEVVHIALQNLARGGTVSLAGIHMTDIPVLPYRLLYGERTLRSVANSTRQDVRELLQLAAAIPIRTEVEVFPLKEANTVLMKLKKSELRGSGVLRIDG